MSDLTPEEIRSLVKEEIDRSTIRNMVAEAETPKGRDWDKILRHPASLAILGFVLTTVFAQFLQYTFELYKEGDRSRAAERTLISREADEAVALLDELVLLAHNRATELSLLRFALIDGQRDVILARTGRYYDYYREWVTTYQPRARQILAQMGVSGDEDTKVTDDPFYKAVESKIGWQAFLLGHDCFRRMMVVGYRNGFIDYGGWSSNELFQCPRSNPRSTPARFLRESYTIARSCATELFFYGRARIRAYEAMRLAQVDSPRARVVVPDPLEDFPEACEV